MEQMSAELLHKNQLLHDNAPYSYSPKVSTKGRHRVVAVPIQNTIATCTYATTTTSSCRVTNERYIYIRKSSRASQSSRACTEFRNVLYQQHAILVCVCVCLHMRSRILSLPMPFAVAIRCVCRWWFFASTVVVSDTQLVRRTRAHVRLRSCDHV